MAPGTKTEQRTRKRVSAHGLISSFHLADARLAGTEALFEYAPIEFEVADDLAFWCAEIPGRVVASADALTGPTSVPWQRVQVR